MILLSRVLTGALALALILCNVPVIASVPISPPISGNRHNPWFLENTMEVTYCIERDERNFPVDIGILAEIVRESLNIWKATFMMAKPSDANLGRLEPFGVIALATQKFVERSCEGSIDIRFLFGKISGSELAILKDPREYIASTVRTEYSDASLKGKGFVYIAPLVGPLSPYDMRKISSESWTAHNNLALRLTILHQLKYIFGIFANPSFIFQSHQPEQFVSTEFQEALRDSKAIRKLFEGYAKDVFLFKTPLERQFDRYVNSGMREFYGLDDGQDHLEYNMRLTGHRVMIDIMAKESYGGRGVHIGQINSEFTAAEFDVPIEVMVYPGVQRVFSRLPKEKMDVDPIVLPSYHYLYRQEGNGVYIGTQGSHSEKKAVRVSFDARNGLTIIGYHDDRFVYLQ